MTWYSILHSPDFWLAVALIAGGMAAGVGMSWAVWAWSERRIHMSAKTIYDTLVKAGMTPEGACAMLGNMRAESAMRSNNVEDRSGIYDADYTARADSGTVDFVNDRYGYGLCQWTLPSRKRELLANAKAWGVSVGDEDMQTAFCVIELRESFPKLWHQLTNSRDLFDCTQAVCIDYENPAVKNVGVRYEYALAFYDEFAEKEAQTPQAAISVPVKEINPDPVVMMLQTCMRHDGYWTEEIDGVKSAAFREKIKEYAADVAAC
ncbi:MAG: hypothetical protein IJV41_12270 [Oscillospiraceae bacterium]|nr:hypothetical protein [Oscillospiraceae bacterium]